MALARVLGQQIVNRPAYRSLEHNTAGRRAPEERPSWVHSGVANAWGHNWVWEMQKPFTMIVHVQQVLHVWGEQGQLNATKTHSIIS